MPRETAKKGISASRQTTGVYTELDFPAYHGQEACSYSRLKLLQRSPAHLRWELDHPTPPSPAMILGSAVDCLVLEPARFNERFDVSRQCSGITKKHERCTKNGVFRVKKDCFPFDEGKPAEVPEWYCSLHSKDRGWSPTVFDDIQVLSKEDSDLAYNIAKSIKNHPTAGPLIDACEPQVSIVWDACAFESFPRWRKLSVGITLQSPPRRSLRANGAHNRLENHLSTRRLTHSRAKYSNFGYHLQAAMYMRACKAHGIDVEDYVIIAAGEGASSPRRLLSPARFSHRRRRP